MALNTLQHATRVSTLSVAILRRSLVLAATVSRLALTDFTGGGGDTVNVRVREKVAAQTRTTAQQDASITRSSVTETPVAVVLDEIYSAIPVSTSEWNLDLEDFGEQVLAPQMIGIAEAAEAKIAAVFNGLAADASFDLTASAADTEDKLIAASEALDNLEVPQTGRYLAISPAIKSRMLKVPNFVRADGIGNGTAIEKAIFGEILGFTVVVATGLTAGTAIAYHRSGAGFAAGAPEVPESEDGEVMGASVENGGVAITWLRQWNPDTLRRESVGQVFAGASAVDAGNRVYKLDTATA